MQDKQSEPHYAKRKILSSHNTTRYSKLNLVAENAAAAKIALLKLSIPVMFIWFGYFIADHLGDSVIAFLTLGFVTELEGHHIKIFGWFWLTVHILFWIFAPEVARNLPASV